MRQGRWPPVSRADGMNRRIIILLIYWWCFIVRRHIHVTFMAALRHDEGRVSIQVFEIQDHSTLNEDRNDSGN